MSPCFGAYLYPVGTHHENLLELILFRCVLLAALVLANAVSPWRNCGHTEKLRFPKLTQLKSRETILDKMKVSGPGR